MAANQYDAEDLRSAVTSGDLSGSQWRAVITDVNGQLAVAGANPKVIAGVLVDDPRPNKWGTFLTRGRVKALAGAAIPLVAGGTPVTTDSAGRFVTATTGQNAHGMAYQAASGIGAIIEIELGYRGLA